VTRQWSATDPALSALAATDVLLVALDFDGTAAPLVDEPMSARALPEVRAPLARLAALPHTIVAYVSGRSMRDLREIAEHGDDSAIVLAGSHGAQYWYPGEGEQDLPKVDHALRDELGASARALIAGLDGVVFEPKALGFGIHARRASAEAERQAFDAVDAFMCEHAPQWRRRAGHNIVEYSALDTGKDAAIGILRARFGATGILFAGDDLTDEDALRVLGPNDVGVRVGAGESAATVRVQDPQEIALLLAALADERARAQE